MSFDDPPTKNGKREGTERFISDKPGDVSICAKIDEVGILSFISFGWVFNYLWKTYRGKSEPCTSWKCSIFDSANVNMSRLEVMWNEELKNKPDNPSLFRVILSFMKYRLILACIIFALCLCFGFIGPTCLVRGLIAFVEDPKRTDSGGVDYIFGAYIVGTMLLVEISRVLLYGACWAVSYRTGIRVRGAVLSLMYKHLMNARTQRNHTPSEIVNVCANDGQRLFDAVTFAPLVLVGPFVLVGGLVYLLKVIGWPSLAGIGVFFIFDVVQAILGVTMVRFRNRAIKQTEKRMNLMGEVIRCIRIIKMNAWEHLFINRINEVRAKEQHSLKVAGYAVSLAIATGTIVPVVATIVTVLVVVAVGSDLKASDAFSSVTVFFVMLFGIRMIPYGSRYLAEASQSIRKIQKMLLYPVYDDALSLPKTRDVAMSFKNAKFVWDVVEEKPEKPSKKSKKKRAETVTEAEPLKPNERNDFALNELNVVINKKELIGICGPVGSGKTSFLHSIVGQLSHDSGDFSIAGAPVLVSQVPCILNATVRENILFGLAMNTQRYYR
uniref:ABC transmembrane type-1 domain-containing protein n=1 Tax=Panagrolaimus sp. ES5 TaxID=591445 RepID=A0AC34GNF9_9BILA